MIPEPDWEPIEPMQLEGGRGSFVTGDPEGDILRVCYFRQPGKEGLVGRAWFGPGSAGPPGHAHGGAMAAVLDEAMGAAAWSSGYPVMAAHLETDFRRMLPIGTDTYLEARVERAEGRKVYLTGRIYDDDGETYAEATGLFIRLHREHLKEIAGIIRTPAGEGPRDLLRKLGIEI